MNELWAGWARLQGREWVERPELLFIASSKWWWLYRNTVFILAFQDRCFQLKYVWLGLYPVGCGLGKERGLVLSMDTSRKENRPDFLTKLACFLKLKVPLLGHLLSLGALRTD